MKRWQKIILWILATPVVLILIFLVSYIMMNKQGVIEPFQAGNQDAKYKILIASQGSEFKEKLVDRFVAEFKSDSTYISVLDCTELNDNHTNGWDAYIIIHTMQIHKMPKEAETFLRKIPDLSKVTLISTSGVGDEHYTKLEVDGISSASRIVAIDPIMDWILPRIEEILKEKFVDLQSLNY